MRTYNVIDKVYVKSNNSTNNIMSRYTYTLIIYILLSSVINIFIGNKDIVLSLIKTTIISLFISSIIAYLINITKKKYSIKKIYTEENTIFISLVISLFGYNTKIIILLIAILISFIIKNIFKDINNSCVIYGLLLIIIYKYINNINDLFIVNNNINDIDIIDYLFSIKYLVPVLSIFSFLYLFYKKGIKYSLIFSYIGTFIFMILLISIFKSNISILLFELLTSNILFIGTFILSDYKITPSISNGEVIYGIILAILSVIFRFIIPELAIILAIIIGTFLINRPLDRISYKFKYNHKLYYTVIGILLLIMIVLAFVLR